MSRDLVRSDAENDITQLFLFPQKVQILEQKLGMFVRRFDQFVVTWWTILEHIDRRAAWDLILIMSPVWIVLNCTETMVQIKDDTQYSLVDLSRKERNKRQRSVRTMFCLLTKAIVSCPFSPWISDERRRQSNFKIHCLDKCFVCFSRMKQDETRQSSLTNRQTTNNA